MPHMVFTFVLGYICMSHIYRTYVDYMGWSLDFTGPQVIEPTSCRGCFTTTLRSEACFEMVRITCLLFCCSFLFLDFWARFRTRKSAASRSACYSALASCTPRLSQKGQQR